MNGSRPRAGRPLVVGLAFVLAVVTGCGDDGDDGAPAVRPAGAERTAVAPEPEDPTAEIEAVFLDYWDAVAEAQSGASEDPEQLFAGLATDDMIIRNVGTANRYADEGIRRTGAPVFTDVIVRVDGESATVAACMDESEWGAEHDGEPVPPADGQLAPHPIVHEVVSVGGGWLIGPTIEPEGLITC